MVINFTFCDSMNFSITSDVSAPHTCQWETLEEHQTWISFELMKNLRACRLVLVTAAFFPGTNCEFLINFYARQVGAMMKEYFPFHVAAVKHEHTTFYGPSK